MEQGDVNMMPLLTHTINTFNPFFCSEIIEALLFLNTDPQIQEDFEWQPKRSLIQGIQEIIYVPDIIV